MIGQAFHITGCDSLKGQSYDQESSESNCSCCEFVGENTSYHSDSQYEVYRSNSVYFPMQFVDTLSFPCSNSYTIF